MPKCATGTRPSRLRPAPGRGRSRIRFGLADRRPLTGRFAPWPGSSGRGRSKPGPSNGPRRFGKLEGASRIGGSSFAAVPLAAACRSRPARSVNPAAMQPEPTYIAGVGSCQPPKPGRGSRAAGLARICVAGRRAAAKVAPQSFRERGKPRSVPEVGHVGCCPADHAARARRANRSMRSANFRRSGMSRSKCTPGLFAKNGMGLRIIAWSWRWCRPGRIADDEVLVLAMAARR